MLIAALERLDRRLHRAADRVDAVLAHRPGDPAFRGLYIDRADVDEALRRPPLAALHPPEDAAALAPTGAAADSWRRLQREGRLTAFDLDVVLVALAPELDLRYERLYAYVQDDVTRKRPTVWLVLELLCRSAAERLACRSRFSPEAPLVRSGFIHLVADPAQPSPPLLAHAVTPDQQVVTLLLGQDTADRRLAGLVELLPPGAVPAQPAHRLDLVRRVLGPLAEPAPARARPVRLHLHGPRGAGKQALAHAVAAHHGAALGVVDVPGLLGRPDPAQQLSLALREVRWRSGVPYLRDVDALLGDGRTSDRSLLHRVLTADVPLLLLGGERPWSEEVDGALVVPVPVGRLSVPEARSWWARSLARAGVQCTADDVAAVAQRFRLTPAAIETAAADAVLTARRRRLEHPDDTVQSEGTSPGPGREDLLAAARRRTGLGLAALARGVEPRRTWADLVLPPDSAAQLREIGERVTHRQQVLEDWGLRARLGTRLGTTALFTGPSGTGKTLAAEVLAHELGVGLSTIDLSEVVSKYIGETEKNLARLFDAAEQSGAVLFFDEADALFGKRSEVRDSHDRYANIEIAYLLERMDRYDGVTVLATNLRGNLDESFLRRLDFAVSFPFPDGAARARIWAGMWPPGLPLDPGVHPARLGEMFKLSGGNIRNVALAAAFAAAAQGRPVAMEHVTAAVRREYQKLGKAVEGAGGR